MTARTSAEIFKLLDFILEKDLKEEFIQNCRQVSVSAGDVIIREREYLKVLPIVISGSIRVFQTKEDREILLYYVEPGQTCMMSLTACFYNNQSNAQAVATADSEILAVPTKFIVDWQKRYESWNAYVLRTFRQRYEELLYSFEKIAFDHIDVRVMDYLQSRSRNSITNTVVISHKRLADELGTTRVVISRILKQYEHQGKLKLSRGEIHLL